MTVNVSSVPRGRAHQRFDTEVGELGIRASGGRCPATSASGWRGLSSGAGSAPGQLVLDDPFAAVDVTTEAAIIDALRDAFGPPAPLERRARHCPWPI